MCATGHGMGCLAIREEPARRLGRWRLPDPGTLPRHDEEDFGWVHDDEDFGWVHDDEDFGWVHDEEDFGWVHDDEDFGWVHDDEDFGWVRDATAVVGRCHAIAAALALAHRAPVRTVRAAIDDHDLERRMDRHELDLLQVLREERTIDEQAMQRLLVDIPWREEALLTLMWTLRPSASWRRTGCGPTSRSVRGSLRDWIPRWRPPTCACARTRNQARRRRTPSEIAAMLDLYDCLQRQARSAQYHGEIWDYRIAPGVVLGRRGALGWLFQDARWEELDPGA